MQLSSDERVVEQNRGILVIVRFSESRFAQILRNIGWNMKPTPFSLAYHHWATDVLSCSCHFGVIATFVHNMA